MIKFDVVDQNGNTANTFPMLPFSAGMMAKALNALAKNSKSGEHFTLVPVKA